MSLFSTFEYIFITDISKTFVIFLCLGMQNVTPEYCAKLIESHEPSERIRQIPALGIDGFTKFLTSEQCDIFDPVHLKVS